MNRSRLQHLITILEAVPPERFNLNNWHCGTAACACGWAALDPQFMAEGFTLLSTEGTTYPIFDYADGSPLLEGFAAVRKFFGLNEEQVIDLFLHSSYVERDIPNPAPQDVINRIKEYLA
jgi:hypothetical protein